MQPFAGVTGDAVALADAGKVYALYLPKGGATTVDLTAAESPLAARWFNPRSGEFSRPAPTTSSRQVFNAPDTNDWALLIGPRD